MLWFEILYLVLGSVGIALLPVVYLLSTKLNQIPGQIGEKSGGAFGYEKPPDNDFSEILTTILGVITLFYLFTGGLVTFKSQNAVAALTVSSFYFAVWVGMTALVLIGRPDGKGRE